MKDLIEVAKKNFPFCNSDYVANYGFVSREGKVLMSPTKICHAGINHPPIGGPFIAIISQIMGTKADSPKAINRSELGEPLVKRYYEWLLNESPMSQVFISKNAKNAIKDRLIILDAHHPRNMLVAACIMHRHIWEEIKVVRVWDDLVKAGVDKDGAFVLAHLVGIGYTGYDSLVKEGMVSLSMDSHNNNHNIFYGILCKGTLTNFKNHTPVNPTKEDFFTETSRQISYLTGESAISTLFQPARSFKNFFFEIQAIVSGKIAGARPQKKNAFGLYPDEIKESIYRYPQLISALADAYPQICEEDAK